MNKSSSSTTTVSLRKCLLSSTTFVRMQVEEKNHVLFLTTFFLSLKFPNRRGTDTNFPFTNQFQLEESQVPFWQEVTDTRFMVVCFVDPIFNLDYGLFETPTCSCSAATDGGEDDNTEETPPVEPPIADDNDGPGCQTVSELACTIDDLSILCQLIEESGLSAALDSGTWTVFAPSNAAFDSFSGGTIPVGQVDDLLLFHAVPDVALSSSDLVCKGTVTMANGKDSRTKCDNNNDPSIYYQTGADNNVDGSDPEIVQVDIEACNGSIVHIIDNVMLPAGFFPDVEPLNNGN